MCRWCSLSKKPLLINWLAMAGEKFVITINLGADEKLVYEKEIAPWGPAPSDDGELPIAGETLADARTGKNGRHALVGLLRQSVFRRSNL
jgi:hypothetical protein